jgi:hypothetical protein
MAESNTKSNTDLETSFSQPQPRPHSIFPKWQRVTYVYIASLAAFSSPVSSNIYLPAMLSIAADLHVSLTKISLTITMYMVPFSLSPILEHESLRRCDHSDLPRHRPNNNRRHVRSNRPPPRIPTLLHTVHRIEYRACSPIELRRTPRSPLHPKLRH